MNLILFQENELERPLPLTDERAKHIIKVLKLDTGDSLKVGLLNRSKGTATISSRTSAGFEFEFQWEDNEPAPDPITLIVGLSRPHTMQKVLQQATTMGVRKMIFVQTELGERSYASSKLWTTSDYKRHLIDGAQQAGSTRIPIVEYGAPLWIAMHLVEDAEQKIVFHTSDKTLNRMTLESGNGIVLAIGSERGWTDNELALFQQNNFTLAGMGDRILRTETAVVSALALTKAGMGAW
jgi:16S rRNA (uracil1498-N3)-methyltransferase